ncbi:MAG: twin-arginine translocase TatA/TatE family subunit [Lentisphaeria bacterium]|jgi:sec-independent protein translocase protein TatA|nr:twin-arginine translocase TatA/TatE family subunit [Lentisphaeria bacterium]MDD6338282.1 twin-arginine translocase TatA/TatE family subunit [Lentisphaeria bacterium]
MHLGFTELFLILVVILLLFGARRIPEIARSLGRASQEYKKAKEDFLAEVNKPAEDMKDAISTDKPAAPSAPAAAEHKDDSAKS